MMKIDTSELYPVYREDKHGWGIEVEIPKEVWEKYQKACNEFREQLRAVAVYYNKANKVVDNG